MNSLIWSIPFSVVFGYLVNFLADVIPQEGKSKVPICMDCSMRIKFLDFLFCRKCSKCDKNIRLRAFVVFAVSILLPLVISFFLENYAANNFWLSFSYIIIFHCLLLILVIDLENKVIYYFTCVAAVVVIAPISLIRTILYLQRNWMDQLWGLIIGAAICAIIYGLGFLFVKLVNMRRKEQLEDVAFGFGDVILGGILGLWLGYPGIILCMVVAILMGGLVSLIFLIIKKIQGKYQPLTAIPYAPFMIISAVVLMFYAYFIR